MDSGIAIIGGVLAATFVFPFAYAYNARSKSERSLLEKIKTKAALLDCKVSKHEFCGSYIIGMDVTKRVVFFLNNQKDAEVHQVVNLSEIRSCSVYLQHKTIKGKRGNFQQIERVALSLIPNDKSQNQMDLCFYEAHDGSQLVGELQSVEDWCKTIKSHLTN